MGVVLKRAIYFITCSGRMYYPVRLEEDAIVRRLEKMPAWKPKYHCLFDEGLPKMIWGDVVLKTFLSNLFFNCEKAISSVCSGRMY